MYPTIEYDNRNGTYRIRFSDGFKTEWTPYNRVITHERKGRKYIAFSHFFQGCGAFVMPGVHEVLTSWPYESVSETI